MSGFEMKPVDEAQFEAFLQGKDDLSRLLRELPQPKSSSGMDAAILAMVSADLGEESNQAQLSDFSTSNAANEAVFDTKQPSIPSKKAFLYGWRVPFGLAASALLAISMWQFVGKNPKDVELAQVDESYPQAAPAVVASPTPADSKKRLEEGSEASNAARSASLERKDNGEKPILAESATKAALKTVEKPTGTEPTRAKSLLKEKHSDQVIAYTSVPTPELRAAPQADEAIPQPSQKAEVREQMMSRHETADDAIERSQLAKSVAKAEDAAQISEKNAAKNAVARVAPSVVTAAPPVVTPATSAITPTPVVSAYVLPNSEHAARAKAWASLVEELLKANMKQEALDEWQKFRKAYPNYPVSDRLQEKIKVLQTGNAKKRSEPD